MEEHEFLKLFQHQKSLLKTLFKYNKMYFCNFRKIGKGSENPFQKMR